MNWLSGNNLVIWINIKLSQMEILIKISRISYGLMVAALGFQQLAYADFRPVVIPPLWLANIPGYVIWVYLLSVILITAGIAIMIDKKTRLASLILGGIFLLLLIFCEIPYEIFNDPNNGHLGVWGDALKELAFAGGAFVVAGSYPTTVAEVPKNNSLTNLLEKLIPLGSVFFSITMVCFGICHLLYAVFISALVPNWIPGHIFWTYFAGVALIGSGLGIIFNIKLKLNALLLALMIFLWFIFLHIPRGVADPFSGKGNEISSIFEAFGFSGTAYLIACGYFLPKETN